MISIAYYLPQFHPTEDNNRWWGPGFTEWTNVASAKPLFKNHDQPKIPRDLGFYDLRNRDVKLLQIALAKEAGIQAFCYWHYWFGNGKTALSTPIWQVYEDKSIDFPFCLAWANHDWQRKDWDKNASPITKEVLISQVYPGKEDFEAHFNYILPLLKDDRYLKIQGQLVFVIFRPDDIPDFQLLKSTFNELAEKNNLSSFLFIAIAINTEAVHRYLSLGFDKVNLILLHDAFKVNFSLLNKLKFYLINGWLNQKNIHSYKDAIQIFDHPLNAQEEVIPSIVPNWDHSPRGGKFAHILHGSNPKLFKQHVELTLNRIKNKACQIVFIRSWNEWGEGNYMEPDQKFGKSYIETYANAIQSHGYR